MSTNIQAKDQTGGPDLPWWKTKIFKSINNLPALGEHLRNDLQIYMYAANHYSTLDQIWSLMDHLMPLQTKAQGVALKETMERFIAGKLKNAQRDRNRPAEGDVTVQGWKDNATLSRMYAKRGKDLMPLVEQYVDWSNSHHPWGLQASGETHMKNAHDPMAELDKLTRFEEGKPADPTEKMSPEDAAEWKKQNEEHKDQFKAAKAWPKNQAERQLADDLAIDMSFSELKTLLKDGPDEGDLGHYKVDEAGWKRAVQDAMEQSRAKSKKGSYAMKNNALYELTRLADADEHESKFEEGKPADPTENMSPEDAAEWKKQNKEHADQFKKASLENGHIELMKLAVGDIPADVERYVKDIKAKSPDYDDAQVWATAWSIYCKYKNPGAENCTKGTSEYFKGAMAELNKLATANAPSATWEEGEIVYEDPREEEGEGSLIPGMEDRRGTETDTDLEEATQKVAASLIDTIRPGDRVTIRTPQGQEVSGRAVMKSSHGGWVLNMGGPHGRPGLVDARNIVSVKPGKRAADPLAELEVMAEGCPDNLDESECKEWEANTEKYKDVVKDKHQASDPLFELQGLTAENVLAEGCPDNLDEGECKEWEANTEKYKDVVKDKHLAGKKPSASDKAKAKKLFDKWRDDAEGGSDLDDLDQAWDDFLAGEITLKDLQDNPPDKTASGNTTEMWVAIDPSEPSILGATDMPAGAHSHFWENSIRGRGFQAKVYHMPAVPADEAKGLLKDAAFAQHSHTASKQMFTKFHKYIKGAALLTLDVDNYSKGARFEEGVPADPTQNMSPEDAQKWKEMNEEHRDNFKTSSLFQLWDTGFKATKTATISDHRTLQQLIASEIESSDGDTKKAKVTPVVTQKAKAFDDAVEHALLNWVRSNMDKLNLDSGPLRGEDDATGIVNEMMTLRGGAGYLYYMEAEGAGVGTWDSQDWEDMFQEEKTLRDLSTLVKSLTHQAYSALKSAIEDAAYEGMDETMSHRASVSPGGLYGYTSSVQACCEGSIRKLTRQAAKIAKAAYKKDENVAPFLAAHAKRSSSLSASILVEALKGLGPKIASTMRLAELRVEKDVGQPIDKTAARKYGLYGFAAKTAKLGLESCTSLRSDVGVMTAEMHGRKADQHNLITGFLKEHSKQAKCMYAKILSSSYPDGDKKTASVKAPTTVNDWISWED